MYVYVCIQTQCASLKDAHDELRRQLQQEQAQREESKRKVKDYVTGLNADKRVIEEALAVTRVQAQEAVGCKTVLESQVANLEMKLGAAKEQVCFGA